MKWISFEEQKPEEGFYLVCYRYKDGSWPNYEVATYRPKLLAIFSSGKKNDAWCWSDEMTEPYEVDFTHWMEIEDPR